MDDLVKSQIRNLQGEIPFNGWTGLNYPLEIQKKSNLWVVKAGARIYSKGFSYDPQKNELHNEWGAVVNGHLDIQYGDKSKSVGRGMFYLISEDIKFSAVTSSDVFLIWFEFKGNSASEALDLMGGKSNTVTVGRYTSEQLKSVLNIAYLLQYHPPGYSLNTQSVLWRFIANSSGISRSINGGGYSLDIQRVLDYIHTVPLDKKITVSQLADVAMLSVETFRKRFQNELGEAPIQYLLRYRISCAKTMLDDPTKLIKQVAIESGFSDQYYFSRLFKHYEGISPLAYRKKMFQLSPPQ